MRLLLGKDDIINIVAESVKILMESDVEGIPQQDSQEDIGKDNNANDYTVDNFDLVSKFMHFNSDDDFYFVEIIKRKKDNPNDAFKYRQFITYYWIKSTAQLQSLKNEIVNICESNNARAYIYLNPRSAQVVNDYAKVLVKRFAQKGKGYGKYRGHEIEFASGQHKDWDSRPISFLDIDSTDKDIFDKVHRILDAYGIDVMTEYKTPNGGLHIILPDKRARNINWSIFDGGKDLGNYATVHFNVDSPSILYSNIAPQGY